MVSPELHPLSPVTLVLGGARSGKSLYAESLIESRGQGFYLATATAGDDEMAARIDAHRARRGHLWQTVEEPLDLVGALRRHARADRPILVDCLTLWLNNLMEAGRDTTAETAALVAGLRDLPGAVVLVSNEVGGGIVPDNALARAFADATGSLNQAVAAAADRVVLVVAGIPVPLKSETP